MRSVVVFESAEELVEWFSNSSNDPSQVCLTVGSIQNSWFGLDSDEFHIAPHITFEELFLELCKRKGIPVKRVGGAKG